MPKQATKAKGPVRPRSEAERQAMLQAIADLRGYDHGLLSPEGVAAFCKPFGMTPRVVTYRVDERAPKGLRVEGKGHGEKVQGLDAQYMAMDIADALGAEYPSKFGRGSQLHAALDAAQALLRGLDL